MLTTPKLKIVLQKFQQRLVQKINNQTMFLTCSADKLLDDLNKCCSSASKEITLEALKYLRILIESQKKDDWKQNEICYSLITPLQTKKFHPLHKDTEISEIKLSLMWLVLQKIQFITYLEGPQHVLEVFIQSCQTWLSCSGEISSDVQNLILKLLHSLFCKEVKIDYKNDSFPQLTSDVLQSEKIFCRLVAFLVEIFPHWGKIENKTDLTHIWNYFLDYCEACYQFIPIVVWHKIFKVVESVCTDENEPFQNKIVLLHKCVTSSKPVMSNSKFMDCSKVLITPAEALLKIIVGLCMNSINQAITFETVTRSKDICQVLCSEMMNTFGYEPCNYVLSKIEEFDSKSLLWAMWCGVVQCFAEQFEAVDLDEFNITEMRLFRRLRSAGANFDLDRDHLEPETVAMIKEHLRYLGMQRICWNCCFCGVVTFGHRKPAERCAPARNQKMATETKYNTTKIMDRCVKDSCSERQRSDKSWEKEQSFHKIGFGRFVRAADLRCVSRSNVITSRGRASKFVIDSQDFKWLSRQRFRKKFNSFYCNVWFVNGSLARDKRIGSYRDGRRSILIPSLHLAMAVRDRVLTKKYNLSRLIFLIDDVKEMERKLKVEGIECRDVTHLCSHVRERDADLHRDAEKFWESFRTLVLNSNDDSSLNVYSSRDAKSVLLLCIFLFLAEFVKTSCMKYWEKVIGTSRKFGHENELTDLCRKIINVLRRISCKDEEAVCAKGKNSLAHAFLATGSDIFARYENPPALWSRWSYVRGKVLGKGEDHEVRERRYYCDDSFLNLCKYVEELRDESITTSSTSTSSTSSREGETSENCRIDKAMKGGKRRRNSEFSPSKVLICHEELSTEAETKNMVDKRNVAKKRRRTSESILGTYFLRRSPSLRRLRTQTLSWEGERNLVYALRSAVRVGKEPEIKKNLCRSRMVRQKGKSAKKENKRETRSKGGDVVSKRTESERKRNPSTGKENKTKDSRGVTKKVDGKRKGIAQQRLSACPCKMNPTVAGSGGSEKKNYSLRKRPLRQPKPFDTLDSVPAIQKTQSNKEGNENSCCGVDEESRHGKTVIGRNGADLPDEEERLGQVKEQDIASNGLIQINDVRCNDTDAYLTFTCHGQKDEDVPESDWETTAEEAICVKPKEFKLDVEELVLDSQAGKFISKSECFNDDICLERAESIATEIKEEVLDVQDGILLQQPEDVQVDDLTSLESAEGMSDGDQTRAQYRGLKRKSSDSITSITVKKLRVDYEELAGVGPESNADEVFTSEEEMSMEVKSQINVEFKTESIIEKEEKEEEVEVELKEEEEKVEVKEKEIEVKKEEKEVEMTEKEEDAEMHEKEVEVTEKKDVEIQEKEVEVTEKKDAEMKEKEVEVTEKEKDAEMKEKEVEVAEKEKDVEMHEKEVEVTEKKDVEMQEKEVEVTEKEKDAEMKEKEKDAEMKEKEKDAEMKEKEVEVTEKKDAEMKEKEVEVTEKGKDVEVKEKKDAEMKENEVEVRQEMNLPARGLSATLDETPKNESLLRNETRLVTAKAEVLVAQNRGSRMLALIAESPKMEQFRDSAPSPPMPKQLPKKGPQVVKNSRASRMLALLPEFQEMDWNDEAMQDENRMVQVSEGMHHRGYMKGKSVLAVQSPKTSAQRKSIRFDEDRNRTLVFHSDSPPCQTIVEGVLLSRQCPHRTFVERED